MGRQTYKASCLWIISTVHLDIRQICKAWMISFLGVWAPVYICSTELPIAKPKKIGCGNICCLKYKHLKGPSNSGSVRSSAFCKHLLRCISGPEHEQPKGGEGRSQRVVYPNWSKLDMASPHLRKLNFVGVFQWKSCISYHTIYNQIQFEGREWHFDCNVNSPSHLRLNLRY